VIFFIWESGIVTSVDWLNDVEVSSSVNNFSNIFFML